MWSEHLKILKVVHHKKRCTSPTSPSAWTGWWGWTERTPLISQSVLDDTQWMDGPAVDLHIVDWMDFHNHLTERTNESRMGFKGSDGRCLFWKKKEVNGMPRRLWSEFEINQENILLIIYKYDLSSLKNYFVFPLSEMLPNTFSLLGEKELMQFPSPLIKPSKKSILCHFTFYIRNLWIDDITGS